MKYNLEVEIPDGEYCFWGDGFCRFHWQNEDGDYGCCLLNKEAPFIEGDMPDNLPKLKECPSLNWIKVI